jgi:transposase-like protein
MTKANMYLSELLAEHDQGGDFLRGIAEAVLELIMETYVEGIIGAGRHERSVERSTYSNGHRERALDTRSSTLNLARLTAFDRFCVCQVARQADGLPPDVLLDQTVSRPPCVG